MKILYSESFFTNDVLGVFVEKNIHCYQLPLQIASEVKQKKSKHGMKCSFQIHEYLDANSIIIVTII